MIVNIAPVVVWLATLAIIVYFLYLAFPIIYVSGHSMHPTYKEGEFLLSSRFYSELKAGDVVVVKLEKMTVIKRVKIKKGHMIFLEGDNKDHSMDSRHFGYIDDTLVMSKVLSPRKENRNE